MPLRASPRKKLRWRSQWHRRHRRPDDRRRGANLPEFVTLGKLARPRTMAVFLVYVFGVAIAGGALAQTIWA